MKRSAVKGRNAKQAAAKNRTVRRASRVQRGRETVQAVAPVATTFARWTPASPWDGQRLGTGLVDTSQLACECGECAGCQQRLG
jgi:hypothetical protein